MKQVFISLLNYNGSENTIDCLESLRNINTDSFKLTIIVVDNASSDNSIKSIKNHVLTSKYGNVKFIENKKNMGFSGGHNTAIRYALSNKADYVLLLNNDIYVDKNFLKELFVVSEQDDNIKIAVPKIYFAPGYEFHKDRYSNQEKGKVFWYAGGEVDWANIIGRHRGVDEVDKGEFDNIEQTEIATGCSMLIKKEVFEKIGNLDDKYFLYYEDADLSMRVKRNGFKIMYVPKSVIWHKNAESTGGSGSTLQDYYITRNRLMFGFRYAPIRTKLALLKESLFLLFNGRKWQKKGALDFYLDNFGKGSYKI